ncbi:MAG: S24/S26 family peptidase [Muribaculaceae bacterium]|nr:S24/S26 family peptidase [Muribaculaceae bacterium]
MAERRTIGNDLLLGEVQSLLAEGKSVRIRAKGDSMLPSIHSGDILTIVPAKEIGMHDVVLAGVDGERYVVHRVVDISGSRIILMGDSNLYAREECRREDVYGKVTGVVHDGRELDIYSAKERFKAYCRCLILPLRRLRHRLRSRRKGQKE